MDDEALWSDDPTVLRDSEWDKLSSDFTNAGYREGITAGKEAAVQQGFDDGFAQVGAPLGRELGILRGLCSALLAHLSRPPSSPPIALTQPPAVVAEQVREIANALAAVRFSDIAPPDLEAIAHAREHLESSSSSAAAAMDEDGADLADPTQLNEELKDKRAIEGLEDLMAQMGSPGSSARPAQTPPRPTAEDVARLKERLLRVAQELGLTLQWS